MQSRAMVAGAVLGAALVSGGWLMQNGFGDGAGAYSRGRLFEEVRTLISRSYVDSVPDSLLYRRAVDGLLGELGDPHTAYLSADRLERLRETTTGRYAGVGIQLDMRDEWVTVVSPLTGTPAEEAGVLAGDRIVEIDGRTTRGLTSDEAVKALRGDVGSRVRITVERPGRPDSLRFQLTRREVVFSPVQNAVMLQGGVGYVDLTVFGEESRAGVQRAVDSLRAAGMRSLVLDLRGNPGGLLDQGVAVSELFLDPGQAIVAMKGRAREANQTFVDEEPQAYRGMPIVVLVDSASASAAEIVAGALQDHDRAAVVGTTSFGKGSAQSLIPTTGGGAVKLTTALWYTPVGRSISRLPSANVADDEADEDGRADADSVPRPKFRTDAGRTVYGGGGITPDVIVADPVLDSTARDLERALGTNIPKFRDALTSYALALRGTGAVRDPAFVVTPAMRAELYRRMLQRGVRVDTMLFERATPLVSRLLGYEIARYVFGRQGEFIRRAQDDASVRTAVSLLAGAGTQGAVFARVKAVQDSTARGR